GALMALAMLTAAARPPDEEHAYGHGKAEYFSSVVEGTLIFLAAISIAVAAVERIFVPRALEQVGLGLGVSVAASTINLVVALERYTSQGIQYHALRTRESGARRFVSLHVLVPGDWTVHRGHRLLERIEADIREAVPDVSVFTHLESLDDPASWDDQALDRPE